MKKFIIVFLSLVCYIPSYSQIIGLNLENAPYLTKNNFRYEKLFRVDVGTIDDAIIRDLIDQAYISTFPSTVSGLDNAMKAFYIIAYANGKEVNDIDDNNSYYGFDIKENLDNPYIIHKSISNYQTEIKWSLYFPNGWVVSLNLIYDSYYITVIHVRGL